MKNFDSECFVTRVSDVVFYAAMFAVVWAIVFACSCIVGAADLTPEEQKAFNLINEFRAQHNLPALQLDDTLTDGARKWSYRMRTTRSFNHGSGPFGENIAMGHEDGETTFKQWERSSGHRAFMLSKTTTHGGIGNDGHYWTFRAVSRGEKPAKETPVATEQPKTAAEPKASVVTATCTQGVKASSIRTVNRPRVPVLFKPRYRYVPNQPLRNTVRTLLW